MGVPSILRHTYSDLVLGMMGMGGNVGEGWGIRMDSNAHNYYRMRPGILHSIKMNDS
jgi:hypothetical protein